MTSLPRIFRRASGTEAIYIKTQTQVVSRSRVKGRITQEQFELARRYLEVKFEILRAVVADECFVEEPSRSMAPTVWLSSTATTADQLYTQLLNQDMNVAASLYHVYVIDHADAFEIFLLTTHSVTDATSLIELHSFLIYLCDCVVAGDIPVIVAQPFPLDIDDAVDHQLALLADSAVANAPASFVGPYLRMAVPAAPPKPAHHRLERLTVEPEETARLIDASHHHGVSLHAVLVAAFALAIGALSVTEADGILMRSSIDMRRRLEPHVATDLVFSAITGHITQIDDMGASIFDIAKVIFSDIHDGVSNGRIFYDYKNYPRSFGDPRDIPVAINISDMGKIEFHPQIKRLEVTGFEYGLGWLKTYPNVSVSIYDGRLIANTVYVEEFIAPERMARMTELILENLRRGIAQA